MNDNTPHILDKSCWCNPAVMPVTPREDDGPFDDKDEQIAALQAAIDRVRAELPRTGSGRVRVDGLVSALNLARILGEK